MRDDELQVLGEPRKLNKQEKWKIAIIAAVLLSLVVALGMWTHIAVAPEQHEIIQTGKKKGEPTIVPELQAATDSILRAEMKKINAVHGQVIVMEVQTGEILALIGLERNFEGKYQPCKNFAYQQNLGSLTKTASLLVALETGKARLNDVVDVGNGIWEVDNGWIMKDHNWRRGGYGEITLDRTLEISSNIGISKTIWSLFKGHEQDFFNMLDSMSFGRPNMIDGIDGLRPAFFKSPKDPDWVDKEMLWSSIGFNQKIAPIQMLTFYNAIANNGKMVKPTLTTGEVSIINPQIASKENIAKIQVVLDHVVSQGLGRLAGTPILRVAGKTGTSQVGEYEFGDDTYIDEYQVAFCGFFPANAPKYSIIVSLNKLGLPASGGGMAGVVFHDIVEWMITHGMPPVLLLDEETNDTVRVTSNNVDSIISNSLKQD